MDHFYLQEQDQGQGGQRPFQGGPSRGRARSGPYRGQTRTRAQTQTRGVYRGNRFFKQ